MFWRFGGYANISTIDTLLDKPDVTLEELLDESDLIQELKQHNTKLIEFLRDENALKRLLQYVIAPGPPPDDNEEEVEDEDEESTNEKSTRGKRKRDSTHESEEEQEKAEKNRLKYSYVACEVLSSETWSILEALMQNEESLRDFWSFMKRPAPLDPLQAGYFTKVNETLLEKKTEEMLEFLKSIDGIIPAILQHVDCPMVMDLLLKIISLEKAEGGQGTVDWLQSQGLIPALLSYLSLDYPASTQTSAGDFLKAIITISANASQNEQSCIGPNSLTRELVSEECVQNLVGAMLTGGNPLTVGVGIVIEVIRKNNSDYDPENGHNPEASPTNHDPIYLGTLLRIFAKHVPDFMELILSSKHVVSDGDKTRLEDRGSLNSAWGTKIEPLGFDRFKTCELMAELLHCSNMGLLNERGSEDFVRRKDAERERLRAQGAFRLKREGEESAVDISEESSQFTNGVSISGQGSDSPEDIRAANTSEDDGFEKVAVSDVPGDQEKAISEGRSSTADEKSNKSQEQPVASIESDLVDEPLTPPKAGRTPEESIDDSTPTKPTAATSSPTPDNLDERVRRVSLEDTTMDTPPTPEAEEGSGELLDIPTPTEPSFSPRPNPDDIPRPLFASSDPEKTPTPMSPNSLSPKPAEGADETRLTQNSMDPSSTGDSEQRGYPPNVEIDTNGHPVVGDYLKLMFVDHKVVPTILNFFFRFPWNNFLHNVVYDVVQQVFNGPMDRGFNRSLAIDLFETGSVTEQIIEGQRRSDEAQQSKNMRLGYMGHLTLVAEEVVKFSERHPPELLSQSVMERVLNRQWIDYVEQTLSDTRERDNAILGGVRPDMSVGPRQAVLNAVNAAQGFGGSAALANAGLNGGVQQGLDSIDLSNNGSSSSSAFGSSGGSLLSGFGSSSDDDDEEMDEAEDEESHVNTTRAALLATADAGPQPVENDSDQPIPLLPPPPAPLNIPPSRARRQLAARLALHKQQATDSQSITQEGTAQPEQPNSTSPHNKESDSKQHFFDSDATDDPFKALDDDEDEEEDEAEDIDVEESHINNDNTDDSTTPSSSRSTNRSHTRSGGFAQSFGQGFSSLFSTSHSSTNPKTQRPQSKRSDSQPFSSTPSQEPPNSHAKDRDDKTDFDPHSSSSSEDANTDEDSENESHPLEATTSKERHPIDIDSDEDEMGEMVGPSSTSNEEDEDDDEDEEEEEEGAGREANSSDEDEDGQILSPVEREKLRMPIPPAAGGGKAGTPAAGTASGGGVGAGTNKRFSGGGQVAEKKTGFGDDEEEEEEFGAEIGADKSPVGTGSSGSDEENGGELVSFGMGRH